MPAPSAPSAAAASAAAASAAAASARFTHGLHPCASATSACAASACAAPACAAPAPACRVAFDPAAAAPAAPAFFRPPPDDDAEADADAPEAEAADPHATALPAGITCTRAPRTTPLPTPRTIANAAGDNATHEEPLPTTGTVTDRPDTGFDTLTIDPTGNTPDTADIDPAEAPDTDPASHVRTPAAD
jgi:hypothetical protein